MDGDAQVEAAGVRRIGTLSLTDAEGVTYACEVYPIRSPLVITRAVYIFSRFEGIWPHPVYVEAAGDLPVMAAQHPQFEPALGLSAIHLLVHRPDNDDPIPVREAAERLADVYRPILNARASEPVALPALPVKPPADPVHGAQPEPAPWHGFQAAAGPEPGKG
ncbi:hypothetical protein [Paralimibaculum aggregatum]|nr:hypothetical protein [Limibaculum sp. NKW23]